MKRLTQTILGFLAAGLCAACMTAPDKKYFHLSLAGRPALPPIDRVLYIDYAAVGEPYDDFRIVYRLSPYEVSFYPYVFWTREAGLVVRDAIADFLKNGGGFRDVVLETNGLEPDLILKSAIHRIEEDDERTAWYARLSADFKISDYKSGRILAARRFDRREPMAEKSVAEFPPAISRILAEELDAVLADLRSSLSSLEAAKHEP